MSYRRKFYGTAKDRKRDEEETPSACARDSKEIPLVNDIHEPRSPTTVDVLHRASMPPVEFARREGESALAAARRGLEIQTGCYGD